MEAISNDFLNEKMYIHEFSNGLKSYTIPKKGYLQKQAIVAYNYGSADSEFGVDGKKMEYPDGIAHFLEHKMFESENGNVFERFTQLGADVNAFTNYTNTAYYFNCTENFDKCFKELLNFVQDPYFTEENVEKEKGIIVQEINMYHDDPSWRGYLALHEAMYFNNPIRKDIAGTEESVRKITKDMLYDCYDSFYRPENMVIVCVGDLDPEEVIDLIDKNISKKTKVKLERFYPVEPKNVQDKIKKLTMNTSAPLFHIGFKDNEFEEDVLKKLAASRLLLDILYGEASSFYEKLYNENIIDDTYGMDYSCGTFFGFSLFSGYSDSPEKVRDAILKAGNEAKKQGITKETVERIKRKHMGKLIRTFNVVNSIATAQVDFFAKHKQIFQMVDAYENIDINYVEKRLNEHLVEENLVMSIVE